MGWLLYMLTKFPHIHCGILFSNGMVAHSEMVNNGVKIEPLQESFDLDHIMLVDVPWKCNENAVWNWCLQQKEKTYDWANVVQWTLYGNTINTNSAYNCTEFCLEALKSAGCLPRQYAYLNTAHVLPEQFYKMLTQ